MIGRVLESARLRSGLTADQVARRAGITRMSLYRIEAGVREPRVGTFRKLCEALGLPPGATLDSM